MTKEETINLLVACRPLAAKLTDEGVDIELNAEEQALLNNFKQLGPSELLFSPDIHRLSGLSSKDIVNLNFMAAKDFIAKVQPLNISAQLGV